jgi:hypothetical protein
MEISEKTLIEITETKKQLNYLSCINQAISLKWQLVY